MERHNDGRVKWTVRIDRDLAERFAVVADRAHRSIEGQIRYLIEQAVEKEGATT